MRDIADIRSEYLMAQLDESTVGNDPIAFFSQWFKEAQDANVSEVNAMTIATVSKDYRPNTRIVLLKGIEDNSFIFYTNYNSAKGLDIENNPNVSLLFFWKELQRQVRIDGVATKVSSITNDEYFTSRPEGSKIGAWSSPQSQRITNRDILDENYKEFENKFANTSIPRPEHWGGYAITPAHIEFWQGRASRMHDRICFDKQADSWEKYRLAP